MLVGKPLTRGGHFSCRSKPRLQSYPEATDAAGVASGPPARTRLRLFIRRKPRRAGAVDQIKNSAWRLRADGLLILECRADKVAVSPNQTAHADGLEIVER